MREIKFRAWYPDENRMEYPNNKTPAWVGDILTDSYYVPMQYTGLKDKNGKEIYEGDVVKSPLYGQTIGQIIFENGCFIFRWGVRFQSRTANDGFVGQGEIIGNIYENPELLEA